MIHKRITALLLIAVLLLGALTGCGAKPQDAGGAKDADSQQAGTAAAQTAAAGEETYEYVPSYQELSEDLNSVCALVDNTLYYTTYGVVGARTPTTEEIAEYGDQDWLYNEYGTQLWAMDLTTGTNTQLTGFQPMEVPPQDGLEGSTYTNNLLANADGTFCALDTLAYYSLSGDGDYQQFVYLRTLNADGTELSRTQLDFIGTGKAMEYVGAFQRDAQGRYYFSDYDNNIIVTDEAGQQLFQVTATGWVDSLLVLADGRLAAMLYENDTVVKVIDPDAKAWGESITLTQSVNHVFGGSGDYLLYVSDQSNLYGYNTASGEYDTLLNWVDCSISGDYVQNVLPRSDGPICVVSQNYSSNINYLITLTLTPSSQIPVRQILTLAALYPSSELTEAVVEFNIKSPDYRIKIIDYSQYNTDDNASGGTTRLSTDLLSGSAPDLIDVSQLNAAMYIKKGLLEDLTPYFEADPDLSLDDLMPCYLAAASVDGKLYQAYSQFSIQTVAGLRSVLGDANSWTWEELEALQAANPGTPLFSSNTTQSAMLTSLAVFGMNELIDWQAGTCSFDSEEFISMLEFAKQFPAEYPENGVDEYTAILNGSQLLTQAYVGSWDMLGEYNSLFGGEVTYIGYPVSQGLGSAVSPQGASLCISSQSQNKDAAWSFVKALFDQSYQERLTRWNGFATNRAAFEAAKATWIQDNVRYDADGNLVSSGGMGWGEGTMLDLYPPTEAQIEAFSGLMDQITTSYNYDEQALAIVSEEAAAFFAGQSTAQAAASVIQGRMAIYISEQS